LLEAEGYRVVCAANGREALDYLHHAELPCLILLDLEMPVMDGWQFRREQSRDPALASIAVVLLSGEDHLDQIANALGVARHLTKPIEFNDLLATVGEQS
jgi:CheY-like chemotaxis protein